MSCPERTSTVQEEPLSCELLRYNKTIQQLEQRNKNNYYSLKYIELPSSLCQLYVLYDHSFSFTI